MAPGFAKRYQDVAQHNCEPTTRVRILHSKTEIPQNYFWSDFPGEPVSPEAFQQCHRVILTPREFENVQETLAPVNSAISDRSDSCDKWGDWTEQGLIDRGFKVLDQPTILAVAESDGRRFAIQFVSTETATPACDGDTRVGAFR